MRQDSSKLTALLSVLVVGQTIIIGALFDSEEEVSLGQQTSLVAPMTAADRELEREAARAELEASLGARRRASRMASLEKANAEARAAVRDLSRRLAETEQAYAALQSQAQNELAGVRAQLVRAHEEVANLSGIVGGYPNPLNHVGNNGIINPNLAGNAVNLPQIVYDQNGNLSLPNGATFTNAWIDVGNLQRAQIGDVQNGNTIEVNGIRYVVERTVLAHDTNNDIRVEWESLPNRAEVRHLTLETNVNRISGTIIGEVNP